MRGTRKNKAQNQQQYARELAEKALDIVIVETDDFYDDTIKALRLTCKRTKAAADAKVKKFTLSVEQEPEAVQRSGLLNNITNLHIYFALIQVENQESSHSRNISRALGLLQLAVDVCSSSVEHLGVKIAASVDISLACSSILGNSDWEALQHLHMRYCYISTGLISAVVARPSSLPALKTLDCQDPSAADIESLNNSAFVDTLSSLTIRWSEIDDEPNPAPATVAAMRNCFQKATKLERLWIQSSTFEFFDSENLANLKDLSLHASTDDVDLAPVLARPWTTLEDFSIHHVTFTGPDLVRLFEAEDTLPVIKHINIHGCSFAENNDLSCVRRPHLLALFLMDCANSHVLISKLAQLMKERTCPLPALRHFTIRCEHEESLDSLIQALCELFSCPQMALLETLDIVEAGLDVRDSDLLCVIANNCRKLRSLNLFYNNLGRPAIALILGYGKMGAWPELQRLEIQELQCLPEHDPNYIFGCTPYLQQLQVERMLQEVWPDLICF